MSLALDLSLENDPPYMVGAPILFAVSLRNGGDRTVEVPSVHFANGNVDLVCETEEGDPIGRLNSRTLRMKKGGRPPPPPPEPRTVELGPGSTDDLRGRLERLVPDRRFEPGAYRVRARLVTDDHDLTSDAVPFEVVRPDLLRTRAGASRNLATYDVLLVQRGSGEVHLLHQERSGRDPHAVFDQRTLRTLPDPPTSLSTERALFEKGPGPAWVAWTIDGELALLRSHSCVAQGEPVSHDVEDGETLVGPLLLTGDGLLIVPLGSPSAGEVRLLPVTDEDGAAAGEPTTVEVGSGDGGGLLAFEAHPGTDEQGLVGRVTDGGAWLLGSAPLAGDDDGLEEIATGELEGEAPPLAIGLRSRDEPGLVLALDDDEAVRTLAVSPGEDPVEARAVPRALEDANEGDEDDGDEPEPVEVVEAGVGFGGDGEARVVLACADGTVRVGPVSGDDVDLRVVADRRTWPGNGPVEPRVLPFRRGRTAAAFVSTRGLEVVPVG